MDRGATPRRLLSAMLLTGVLLIAAQGVARAQFGIATFSSSLSESQAGAHADFTTSFTLNTDSLGNPIGQLQNASVTLPQGLLGNPQAIERCSTETFQRQRCPSSSQIGVLASTIVACHGIAAPLTASAEAGATTITVANSKSFCVSGAADNTITIGTGASAETAELNSAPNGNTLELAAPLAHAHASGDVVSETAKTSSGDIPVFNLQPSPGHVATFGVSLLLTSIVIQVNVGPTGSLVATMNDLSTLVEFTGAGFTLWGVPADPHHNPQRCIEFGGQECNQASTARPAPFMSNPTSCASTLQAGLNATSWGGQSAEAVAALPPLTGCEKLTVAPRLSVGPSSTRRDSPAGYEVNLEVPQQQEPYELATPALKTLSVTLPEGVSLSPTLANGLEACTDAQFRVGGCPNASKVGTTEVATPMLASRLTGQIFIGAPTATEKYRLFLLLRGGGLALEMAGQVEPSSTIGQLTTVFENAPPVQFSDFKLNFFGGPAATLANPASCGAVTSSSRIEAYSGQIADPSSTFEINENPEGGACTASPFTPTFVAGVINPLAGGTSPFTFTLARADGQQNLSSFTTQLPAGLGFSLRGVTPCVEPQAREGTCGQDSQIGTALISMGAGPLPVYATGQVYLTGPYEGAPFGLEIAIDAEGSPFDLGTLVTRSRILVNSRTVALTISSNPLTQIVDGIPLRIRAVNVTLSHPGLVVNPTSCAPQAVTAVVESAQGASADLASPFEVDGCEALKFAPRISARAGVRKRIAGEASASLEVNIVNAAGPNASIRTLDMKLPAQLHPRIANTRKACMEAASVAVSAAACPASSIVGHATVNTLILPAPLSGPVYLVARGGNATPLLVMLLQGQGINVELVGSLEVSSSGRASTVFGEIVGAFPLFIEKDDSLACRQGYRSHDNDQPVKPFFPSQPTRSLLKTCP